MVLTCARYLGVVMASTDPVANDSIGSELLGIERNELIFRGPAI